MPGYNEFDVGERVRIVGTPYTECPFSWVDSMTQYCSMEAEITAKTWSKRKETYYYRIDIDRNYHMWCGNCFEALQEDVPISEEDFERFLFSKF